MARLARAALLAPLALAACASTRTAVEWRDPRYDGRIGKVLVAVAVEGNFRSAAEDAFVAVMPKDVEALQSYQIIPAEAAKDREAVRARIVQSGFEGALVSRIVDSITTEQSHIAPVGTQTMYDYWGYAWTSYQMGTVTETHRTLFVETRLYDLRTERAVWSVTTETYDPNPSVSEIRKLVDRIWRRLDQAKIVRAR